MRHDHGAGVGTAALDVHEVDIEPLDFRLEMWPAVKLRLAASPIIVVAPIFEQLLGIR